MLVVDDECIIADSTAMILNQSGWEAIAVYDGNTAVEEAVRFLPQVVFSEVLMPGMNGVEASKKIGEILPDCKFILISGDIATAELVASVDPVGRALEVIPKPLRPESRMEMLRVIGSIYRGELLTYPH